MDSYLQARDWHFSVNAFMLNGARYHGNPFLLGKPCVTRKRKWLSDWSFSRSPAKSRKHTADINMYVFSRLRRGHMLIRRHICIIGRAVFLFNIFVCADACSRVFLQENLLDADHHVAVALGPAVKPGSAVRIHKKLKVALVQND